jgi:hypothetical protein
MSLTPFELLERDGIARWTAPLAVERLAALAAKLETCGQDWHAIRQPEQQLASVVPLASSPDLQALAERCCGGPVQVARVLLFDKQTDHNWLVPWHQDRTIAVDGHCALPDWGPWTSKAGQTHVQPPLPILSKMVTLRLHLDDADADHGGLRAVPGSHQAGLLSADQIARHTTTGAAVDYPAKAGETLLMRPLLIHASGKARGVGRRRVVHIEYCAAALPAGLSWAFGRIGALS